MPRINPLPEEKTSTEVLIAYQQHKTIYNGRITNMKATLGHSYNAFESYMRWYPLYQDVKQILGDRLSPLFAWAISEAADCPLCSTFFRKIIIEAGENPEMINLNTDEQSLLTFGATIAQNKGYVPDEVFEPIRKKYSDKEIVVLIAFAGIMIATNIFNNVIGTDIDEYLHLYIKSESVKP
ncbi:MAG: carboxymuconolactone decarboxylase family protein [Flammeovirgaceae bacterium]